MPSERRTPRSKPLAIYKNPPHDPRAGLLLDEIVSPTSSSSNGSSGELYHPMQHQEQYIGPAVGGDCAVLAPRESIRECEEELFSYQPTRTEHKQDEEDGKHENDGEAVALSQQEADRQRFQLAIALDFETDTTFGSFGTPVQRKISSSFSDLGDDDEFSLAKELVTANGQEATPPKALSPFYPISEDDTFRFPQTATFNGGYHLYSNGDSRNGMQFHTGGFNAAKGNGFTPPQTRSGGRMTPTGGRLTPSFRVTMPTDASQPLVGDIYPIAGEVLRLQVENAAYIIFYKSDDSDAKQEMVFSSSSSEDAGEFSTDDEGTGNGGRPPRSYASLGAAGHKVQTTNCFTRDYTHPTRSLGRGLFRASTSVGSAFLKGAAGLVNQTYQGGANGGVFGFAKGLGMGMLGLGTHAVKGAFRGVGQVTNVVGEMVLGSAPHFSIDGTLVLTNYRVIWMPQSANDAMEIPLSSIVSAESSTTAPHVANIECKSLLRASIAFEDEATAYDFLNCIWELYYDPPYVFAHQHYQALLEKTGNSDVNIETPIHQFYNPEQDYRRMKLLAEDSWMRLYDNSDYALFPSYPDAFVIPSVLDDEELRELSVYRSASRIPAVVWRHPHSGALACRCAQPCAGLSGYVAESDQKLIAALQRATSEYEDSKFHFFDARSQMAATANSAQGKGTEDPRNYPNSELHFCDIANIHAVRSSYSSLSSVCQPGQERYGSEWLFALRNTFWFMHISRILATSQDICRYLDQGDSVMIHCSDGWDRTPQLTTMVQLLLDPYYRTLNGFLMLIEKEWCSFGHMFRHRYSHGDGPGQQEVEEQSPVFIQWLDSMWQVWRQQPWAFEFNEALLAALYEHVFSGLFGTFLYNCERERKEREAAAPTRSLWFALLEAKDKYVNLEYDSAKNFNSVGVVLPFSSEEDDLLLWENHLVYADPVCRKYE